MRSSGVPARARPTAASTAARTSSSLSDAGDHAEVRRVVGTPAGAVVLEAAGIPAPAEPGERPQDTGVGIGDAGVPGQHGDRGPVGQGAEEAGRAWAELLREEDEDGAETPGHRVLAGQLVGGRGH